MLLETPGYELGEWFALPQPSPGLKSVRYHEPVFGDLQSFAGRFDSDPLAVTWDEATIASLSEAEPELCAKFVHWACWGERHCAGHVLYHQDNILRALRRILETC